MLFNFLLPIQFLLFFLINICHAEASKLTKIHAPDYCAMYGVGGKTSFFGPQLPKPQNIPSQPLLPQDYSDLLDICGDSWSNMDNSCCDSEQIAQLKQNLAKIDPLISSCPACRENFYQMFCHFTCSPDQSLFMDIKKTSTSMDGNTIVDELDFYINGESFASKFYDSCKNIKFGSTNGYAMDLIGGGAKSYDQFLKFLGDKKPEIGGSPFQINFLYDDRENIAPLDIAARSCDDDNENFRCACSDCPAICPILDSLPNNEQCRVGILPCFSLTVISVYGFAVLAYLGIIIYLKLKNRKGFHPFGAETTNFLVDDSNSFEDSIVCDSNDDSFASRDLQDLNQYKTTESYVVNDLLEKIFYKHGYFCSMHPKKVIISCAFISILLSSFIFLLKLEKNPVNLWVSPYSDAYIQKEIFDESFGPFYRTQQILISNSTGDSILQDYGFIKWWFEKEQQIQELKVQVSYNGTNNDVSYDNICFKPLEETCILESFTQYFDGNLDYLPEDNWQSQIENCASSPVECLPSFQQPLKRSLLFGGDISRNVLESEAIVVTFLVNNDNNPSSKQVIDSVAWEHALEEFILSNITAEANSRGLDLSFITEISLEKELNKSTNTDIKIVIVSYLVMFAYASLALGGAAGTRNGSLNRLNFSGPFGSIKHGSFILKIFTKTRFGLGLIGILIVLLSVSASVGFWSLMGLKSTLIIAEVIPFLVLAIGVDNIFLISNELSYIDRLNITNDLQLHERVGKAMANIGPSIILSSSCLVSCFCLASLVSMPAVKNFALYSAFAIVFNTILQLTAFVSIISLDQQRIEKGQLDLLPFITTERDSISLPEDSNEPDNETTQASLSQLLNENCSNHTGIFTSFFQNYFGPFLFKKPVRTWILSICIGLFGISLSLLPTIKLGLDQRIAIPSDSYLINYFDDIYEYLNVGPPIYFIVDDFDVTELFQQQQLCSKFTTCDSFSLVNILEQEYKRYNESTIAEPVASWIDDFFLWLNPELTECCRLRKNVPDKQFCSPYQSPRLCDTCFEHRPWDFKMNGFPEGEEFMVFFEAWLDAPSYPCPLGGKAPYSHSIFMEDGNIKRSVFRTSHVPLRSQDDFINAYHNSLRVVQEIKEKQSGMNLFAYSPFYIFFVQYENIKQLTIELIFSGMGLVFLISSWLLGSARNSLVLCLNLIIIMVNIGGWMVFFDISLNAVSLVNLMICLGLSVEFSIHLIKHFNFNESGLGGKGLSKKMNRAYSSLVFIGNSTLSGITLTKLIGISVLGFTRSKIFQIYYFKMWLGLIIIASIHSLVILPLLLGYLGSERAFKISPFASISNEDVLRRLRESL